MVVPGSYFIGCEIRDSLIKFDKSVFKELETVFDGSFLNGVDGSELPFDSGTVIRGGSDFKNGVVYGRGYDLWE